MVKYVKRPSLKVWTKMNTQVAFNTTTTHHGKLFDQFQTLVETRYTTKSSQTKPNPNLKKKKSQKKMKPVSGVRPLIGKFNYSFSFETMHRGGQPLNGTMHVSYVEWSHSMNIFFCYTGIHGLKKSPVDTDHFM